MGKKMEVERQEDERIEVLEMIEWSYFLKIGFLRVLGVHLGRII